MIHPVCALAAFSFALAQAIGAFGSSRGSERSLLVIDGFGRRIALPTHPRRLVLFEGFETVAALGAAGRVVGVSIHARRNPRMARLIPHLEDLPTPGSGFSVNLERLVSLKPDLVITWAHRLETVQRLESQGISVLALFPRSVDDVFEQVKTLGALLDAPDRAARIETLMRELFLEINQRVASIPIRNRPRAVFLLSDAVRAASRPGVQGELIRRAGGQNVVDDRPEPYATIPQEMIVHWDPQVALLWDGARVKPSDLCADRRWQTISAIKSRRIHKTPPADAWTPEVAAAALRYASWFHPDRFDPREINARIDRFHRELYGLDPDN